MEKLSLVINIHLVHVNQCVEGNALVYKMELVVKNTVGKLKCGLVGDS